MTLPGKNDDVTPDDKQKPEDDDRETVDLTQDELDDMVERRLADQKRTLLKPFDNFAELEKKAKAFDDLEAENQTELEKLQGEMATTKTNADNALALANETLIRSEFITHAAAANVANPEDAYALADRTDVVINDKGKVEGVAEQVLALVKAKRLPLRAGPPAPDLDGGAGGDGRPGDDDLPELTVDEETVSGKLNVKKERYAKAKKNG